MTAPFELPDEWRQLFDAVRDESLSEPQLQRLEELLLTDVEARRSYVGYMSIVSELQRTLGGLPGCVAEIGGLAEETVESLNSGDRDTIVQFFASRVATLDGWGEGAGDGSPEGLSLKSQKPDGERWPRVGRRIVSPVLVAACLLVAAIGLAVSGYSALRQAALARGEVVAELQTVVDCAWGADAGLLSAGAPLKTRREFHLLSGTARLGFQSGATVIAEGPTRFELLGPASLRLHSGTVVVRANGPIKDFQVITPDASIIDLGTSFGVHFDSQNSTEVEVFEGAVEVRPDRASSDEQVFGLGAAARVVEQGSQLFASEDDRFGNLLMWLWDDMRGPLQQEWLDGTGGSVQANFSDGEQPGAVDTFTLSSRGQGWLTPWVACGNPMANIRVDEPLSQENPEYLSLRFGKSFDRTVGREYGAVPGFDPNEPHVISWRWRYDDPAGLSSNFRDRIHFYGNPHFRRNSWHENSWLFGVAGGHERVNDKRQVVPGNWYLFDGDQGDVFENSNMIDTGLKFKPGVVYSFAVIVHPEVGKYDIVIRDDVQTYQRSGLGFRNQNDAPSRVLHFGACVNDPTKDTPFSLDSIRVEPLHEILKMQSQRNQQRSLRARASR